jgi:hypothetical protein
MSIDKQHGKYIAICDTCGDTDGQEFESYGECVDHKRNENWKSKRDYSGEWTDTCPSCQLDKISKHYN